jgi:hypothetical protein
LAGAKPAENIGFGFLTRGGGRQRRRSPLCSNHFTCSIKPEPGGGWACRSFSDWWSFKEGVADTSCLQQTVRSFFSPCLRPTMRKDTTQVRHASPLHAGDRSRRDIDTETEPAKPFPEKQRSVADRVALESAIGFAGSSESGKPRRDQESGPGPAHQFFLPTSQELQVGFGTWAIWLFKFPLAAIPAAFQVDHVQTLVFCNWSAALCHNGIPFGKNHANTPPSREVQTY